MAATGAGRRLCQWKRMHNGVRTPAPLPACDISIRIQTPVWRRCSSQLPWACCTSTSSAVTSREGPRCVTATVRGGVLKLSANQNESHCGVVPLLDVDTTGLPFAANLEFVCACNSGGQAQQRHPAGPVTQDVVELVYVLSGHGHLVEASSGVTWPVQPGVSAVTWARSTYIQPASTDAYHDAEPLAVLKFFLPMTLLSAHPTMELDTKQRQLLKQASSPVAAPGQRLQRGILDDAQAVQLLTAAHARAWQGPQSEVQQHQQALLSNLDSGPGQLLAPLFNLQHAHALPSLVPKHMYHALGPRLQALMQLVGHSTDQAGSAVHGALSYLHQRLVSGRRHLQEHAQHAHTPRQQSYQAKLSTPVSGHFQYSSVRTGSKQQLGSHSAVLMARAMEDFKTFQLPKQTNQLAFVFDPIELGLSLSFGVEIFEPGHHTPLHVHGTGHELFFILAGEGDAYCDGWHIPVRAGDCIVFPPGTSHGLDNNTSNKLYAIQLMAPDDEFTSFVQQGLKVNLKDEDLCAMTARSC